MKHAITGLRHTGIVVADLDDALSFYRGVLGFRIERRMEEGGTYLSEVLDIAGVTVVTVKMTVPGGGMVELLHFPDHQKDRLPAELTSLGLTHIALSVDDLEALCADLQQRGISFRSDPRISPDGKVKIAFCQAPDGTWLELVEEL